MNEGRENRHFKGINLVRLITQSTKYVINPINQKLSCFEAPYPVFFDNRKERDVKAEIFPGTPLSGTQKRLLLRLL
jgi:hypothetical protein